MAVGFVLDYIPDPGLISKEAILTRDSYTDRWLGALQRAGVDGTKYVPSRQVRKTETYHHRFGHRVKLVPTTHRSIPVRSRQTRQVITGATSPLYRLEMMAFTLNLLDEIKKDRTQIVHYSNYYTTMFLYSPLVSLRVPVVTWFTGGDVPRSRLGLWSWYFALRPALSRARLVMMGEYPERRKVLLWLLKGREAKMRPFQLLRVDQGLFRPMEKSDAKRRLGYQPAGVHVVSVLSIIPLPHNDPDMRQPFTMLTLFSRALARLGQDSGRITLTVIGTGPGLEQLKSLAKELGIEERVRFVGRVEHDELPTYYAASDIVFVPYRLEALNETNVLAEAFSCSRPVIAYKRRKGLEVDQPGGFLVDMSLEEGGDELAKILLDPRSLSEKSSEARSLSSQFDLATASRDLLAAYMDALKESPSRK